MKLVLLLLVGSCVAYAEQCQKGYMRDAESGDCVECPKGTYSDMEDAASCTSCPEGTDTPFNASPDVKYCIDVKCEPGYGIVFHYEKPECRICSPGYYSVDDISTKECMYCPSRYTNKEYGSTSCPDCRVGRFRHPETGRCPKCPIGTYNDVIDATSCKPCPEGTTTHDKGSVSAWFCQDLD